MWLKVNYPLAFWVTSLHYAPDKEISTRLMEMKRVAKDIDVKGPNINKSGYFFGADIYNKEIYFSLTKVKGIAQKTCDKIIEERDKEPFTSATNFIERMEGSGVGYSKARDLIYAGAFDNIYNVPLGSEHLRMRALKEINPTLKVEEKHKNRHYWILRQKELIGFGNVDFENIVETNTKMSKYRRFYKPISKALKADKFDNVLICASIEVYAEKKSKKGPYGTIKVVDNTGFVELKFWADYWEQEKENIQKAAKNNSIVIFYGRFDEWNGYKSINSFNESKFTIVK